MGGLPAAYRVAGAAMVTLAAPLFIVWLREHRREVLPPAEPDGSPDEPAVAPAAPTPEGME